MNINIRHLSIIFLFLFTGFTLQNKNLIEELIVKLRSYSKINYQEKIYINTDSDVYNAGEIIWFSAHLLDAQKHTPSIQSKILHVKLYNTDNKELYHKKIETINGVGNADILLSDTLTTGVYYLSAYTEWMRNFPKNLLFQKELFVVNKSIESGNLSINNLMDFEVDFFPEGGSFVEKMKNIVGFKALGSNGYGIDINGFILNDLMDTIVTVKSYKNGMGNFIINPSSKRSYDLYVKHGQSIKKFRLPNAQQEGVNLTVKNNGLEGVHINIKASRNFRNEKFTLLSQCRGKVNFAAVGEMNNSGIVIPVDRLGTGINQITIFNETGTPLLERLVFNIPKSIDGIEISSLKDTYGRKSKVDIVLDNTLSASAEICISVNNRPKLSNQNIENYLLLTSELKGKIENPDYYFNDTDSVRNAADNLMLTQGWRRFSWGNILNDSSTILPNISEKDGVLLKGRLIEILSGEIVTDTLIVMSYISRNPNFLFNKLSGNGDFIFAFYDKYGSHNVIINVFGNDLFDKYKLELEAPFMSLYDVNTIYMQNEFKQEIYNYLNLKAREDIILNNYKIYNPDFYIKPDYQPINIHLSYNLLSSPEHEVNPMNYQPLNSLKELLFELVPQATVKRRNSKEEIFVLEKEQIFQRKMAEFNNEPSMPILNGIPVFNNQHLLDLDYKLLDNVATYTGQYVFDDKIIYGVVSVTTHDINSEEQMLLQSSNAVLFNGLSLKREFYNPKYLSKDNSRIPDLRKTLYWNPKVILKKDIPQSISFYTSDVLGDYHINIEGMTSSGEPIVLSKKITVLQDR